MLERLLLLGWMILLCGYAANVSAVELIKATPEMLSAFYSEEMAGDAPVQLEAHDIGDEIKNIFSRAAAAAGESTGPVKLAAPAFGGYWFVDGYDRAIHAAIGFFLVAKLWRLGIYIYYGFCLPKFRTALWLNALALTIIAGIYIPIALTSEPFLILILLCSGILVELLKPYVIAAAIKLALGNRSGRGIICSSQLSRTSTRSSGMFCLSSSSWASRSSVATSPRTRALRRQQGVRQGCTGDRY